MKVNHTNLYNHETKLHCLLIAGGIILLAGFTLHASRASAQRSWFQAPARPPLTGPTGFNIQRTGENPFESILTPATVGGLHELWSFDLGAVTIMQPVMAAGVVVNGSPKDLVYMGAEHGDLYAIDVVSGSMVWHRNLGSEQTRCADMPDGVFGVSGSPVLDRPNNQMFVVGGDGKMYALGSIEIRGDTRGGLVVGSSFPSDELSRSAVNVNNGIAYAVIASYCDFTPYHGKVAAVDIRAHKRVGVFLPAGPDVNGGGIWGTGGVSIDPATGNVFTATGNALIRPQRWPD